MKKLIVLSAALIACVLTACAGSNAVPTNTNSQCTGVAPPALLYPAPGATGIAAGNLTLYLGYPINPLPGFSVPTIVPSNGGASITGNVYTSPSPGPTPTGSLPLPSGDQEFVSSFAASSPGTTYAVNVTNAACNQTYNLGSFST